MDRDLDFDRIRRRDIRKRYEAEIYFSVAQKAYTATIKNISRGGALIYTGGMPIITPGEKIILTIPFTNKEVFDAICEEEGLEKLGFTNQIKAPNRKISAQKFYDTGYKVQHDDPNAAVVERVKAKA